jgi:hypothetical protein
VAPGASLLACTKSDIKAYAKAAGAHPARPLPPFNRVSTLDCDSPGPDLDITLGGKVHTPKKEDYIIKDGAECLFAMTGLDVPAPAGPLYIPGGVVMRAHYAKFDVGNKQIGIATIKR